ncbi:hypothetical protein ACROYT_G000848 [Oculina patagonica]
MVTLRQMMLILSKKTSSMKLFKLNGNTPSQDLLIVMGDLNAMVGTVNTGNERVMGRHGYGATSPKLTIFSSMENGDDLCKMFETPEEKNAGTANEGSLTPEWDKIVKIYHTADTSTLGYKQKSNKEWLSTETWDSFAERNRAKRKIMGARSTRLKENLQAQYSKLNAKVKPSARGDKRGFVENLETEAEAAAQNQEQGTVYRITKQICGGQRTGKAPICSKQGALLTTEKEQEERWAEHFQEVLNKEVLEKPATAQDAEEVLKHPLKKRSWNPLEILRMVKHLVRTSLMLSSLNVIQSLQILLPVFAKVWNGEGIQSDWSKGDIMPIPNIGTLSDCNNWRGITLLSLPSKIFC